MAMPRSGLLTFSFHLLLLFIFGDFRLSANPRLAAAAPPPASPPSVPPIHTPNSPPPAAPRPNSPNLPPSTPPKPNPPKSPPSSPPTPNSPPPTSPPPDKRRETPTTEAKGSKRLSGGQKAGIVMGVFIAAGAIGFGGMVYKKRRENIRRSRFGFGARRTAL